MPSSPAHTSKSSPSISGHRAGYLHLTFLACTLLLFLLHPTVFAADKRLVRNIRSGSASSEPMYIIELGEKVYFSADDGQKGRELWSSDGKSDGTRLVKDVLPGKASAKVGGLIAVNNIFFFSAVGDGGEPALWKSDGSANGTLQVKDVNPHGLLNPRGRAVLGDILYFVGSTPDGNTELWRSDGTADGTYIVKEFYPGDDDYDNRPRSLTTVGSSLYLSAYVDSEQRDRLWKSDGTTDGTLQVPDSPVGPSSLTVVGNTLFFADPWSLWKVEGESAVQVEQPEPFCQIGALTNVDGVLFFSVCGGTPNLELWKSDGTSDGTVKVTNLHITSYPANHIESGFGYRGVFLFATRHDQSGVELWRSDGTEAGTFLIKDIYPGFESSNPQEFSLINGHPHFITYMAQKEIELWKTDSTEQGTTFVTSIKPEGMFYTDSTIDRVLLGQDILMNAATTDVGWELWAIPAPAPVLDLHTYLPLTRK